MSFTLIVYTYNSPWAEIGSPTNINNNPSTKKPLTRKNLGTVTTSTHLLKRVSKESFNCTSNVWERTVLAPMIVHHHWQFPQLLSQRTRPKFDEWGLSTSDVVSPMRRHAGISLAPVSPRCPMICSNVARYGMALDTAKSQVLLECG